MFPIAAIIAVVADVWLTGYEVQGTSQTSPGSFYVVAGLWLLE
jgi:hypothetical protein